MMQNDWPSYPELRFTSTEYEPLQGILVASIRKLWSTIEKSAQFLYEDSFSHGMLGDGETDLQVRLALPIPEKHYGERRFFSAFLEWGAPSEASDDTSNEEGMDPMATFEIYEVEGLGWLREVARCVILAKDLHVKYHVSTLTG